MKLKIALILLIISSFCTSYSQQYINNPKFIKAEFSNSLILERIQITPSYTYFYFKFKLADYTLIKKCFSDSIILRDPWQKRLQVLNVIGFQNIKNEDITKSDSLVQIIITFGHISDSANIIDLFSISEKCFFFHSIDISKKASNYIQPQQNVKPTIQTPNLTVQNNKESFDLIIMKDGSEIGAKIIDIGTTEIKYKKNGNIDGPSYSCLKSEVFMIKYSNGTKDIFNEKEDKTIDLCASGENDAVNNFHYSGAGTFFLTAFFSPIIGVIATSAISSNKPQRDALNAPNPELLKNVTYKDCYVDKAHSIKKHAVWTGFWMGFIVDILLYAIILNAQ